ncbi:MAG TPA: flippase [Candidatus Sulfotelmatobacter sp.]|nr:flippase [Candidatus Sulfotelmatobacter sp.]
MDAIPQQMPGATAPATDDATSDILPREFKRNLAHISRQALVFFAGTLFTMAAGYLVKIYVARVLGAELLGLYALGMTLVSLTQLLGTLGLHSTAARYVAVYNATAKFDELRSFLTRSIGIVALLNLIFSFGLVFGGRFVARVLYHAPGLQKFIPLFALLAFLGAINVFYAQVLGGFKDVAKRTVITNFVGSPLVAALTVILLALRTGMWGYLAAQIITAMVLVILLVAAARKLTPRAARFARQAMPPMDPEIKAFAAASFGMGVLDFVVCQADKIMLGLYLKPSLVGIYVLASTLSAFIPIVLQSVNQIFAPVIADLHAQSRLDVLQKLFQTLTKWVVVLTLPLASVMIVFAGPLMRIFGPEFEIGWTVLMVGAVGQIVNCATGSVGYLLLMSGNQRRLIRVQFAMAGISIALNVLLIPAYGIVGAAMAAACVNVAGNVWNLWEVRRALHISPYNRSYSALILPTAGMLTGIFLFRHFLNSFAHAWLGLGLALIGSYVLFGALTVWFGLDSEDRLMARGAWVQFRSGMQKLGVSVS